MVLAPHVIGALVITAPANEILHGIIGFVCRRNADKRKLIVDCKPTSRVGVVIAGSYQSDHENSVLVYVVGTRADIIEWAYTFVDRHEDVVSHYTENYFTIPHWWTDFDDDMSGESSQREAKIDPQFAHAFIGARVSGSPNQALYTCVDRGGVGVASMGRTQGGYYHLILFLVGRNAQAIHTWLEKWQDNNFGRVHFGVYILEL